MHRALETWDLAADPKAELKRQLRMLPAMLSTLVEGEILEQALPRARGLLARFAQGPLLGCLRALGPHLLAREFPVLLPPTEREGAPVGFISGAIDLLYRDSATGRLVIADYKTDDVATEEDLEARARVYAPQGATYVRALQEALDLTEPSRFELWFLQAGHRRVIP